MNNIHQLKNWQPGPLPIHKFENRYADYQLTGWANGFVVSNNGGVWIYDYGGKLVKTLKGIKAAANANTLVIQNSDNSIAIHNISTGNELGKIKSSIHFGYMSISNDSKRLFCTGYKKAVLYDLTNMVTLWENFDLAGMVNFCSISPDNRYVFTREHFSFYKAFKVWDANSGILLNNLNLNLDGDKYAGFGMDFDSSGRMIVASGHGCISAWECDGWKEVERINIDSDVLSSMCIYQDCIFLCDMRQNVYLIDLFSGKSITKLELPVSAGEIIFLPENNMLVVLGPDAVVTFVPGKPEKKSFDQPLIPDILKSDTRNTITSYKDLTVEDFAKRLESIEWFKNLGKASKWDNDCRRITDWYEWPGPEDEGGDLFFNQIGKYEEAVRIVKLLYCVNDLKIIWDKTYDKTYELSAKALGNDLDGDAWDLRSMAPVIAAMCAAVIACYINQGWTIPGDMVLIWELLEEGYLPCAFSKVPKDENIVMLLVF